MCVCMYVCVHVHECMCVYVGQCMYMYVYTIHWEIFALKIIRIKFFFVT